MESISLGTVVVTGGAGFIGCALSQKLAAHADAWIAVDVLHSQVHATGRRPAALADEATLVVADVTDPATWDSLLRGRSVDTVIHLAAETGTAQSLDEATRHAHVNVVGTTVMLDAFTRTGKLPSRVLLSSSRAVYGEGRWVKSDGTSYYPGQRSHARLEAGKWDFPGARPAVGNAANTMASPTSIYGATKLAQEHILGSWTAARDVGLTILRLQNVYGPGQSLDNSYTGIVSLFSQLARDGKKIPVYEDGAITRDFVFIDDVAEAFVAALVAAPLGAEVVDVGAGTSTTILELAAEIAAFHSAPEPTVTGAYRDGDVRFATADITATIRLLSWRPQFDLRRGVAALQEWIAQERPCGHR